ncbi:uncharacterized protein RSE6_02562 [Rhynchosporium secalis]|uniref:Heterokaryon incompatibility domain-containing protein n=1 Tax=Rhynchosporium secalis TaxID=38038 RepID=A0A1E1M0L3_RHYSE|nr:uncharacterized protein RSE6_02562 [Rhynchosporium secalis]
MTDSNITSRLRKLRFGRRNSPTRSVHPSTKASTTSSQKSQRPARIDIYRQLDPSAREVRVLHVLPEQPGSLLLGPDPISCVLSHVSLHDKPTYHALSYTWDDESLGETFEDPDDLRRKRKVLISGFIFLDGQAVEVTPNLWAALWHLRRGANWFKNHPDADVGEFGEKLSKEIPIHFTYETHIWIDALCINQLDVAERNEQVQLMGELYQNAQCVHSWTGLEFPNAEDFVEMAAECYKKHHRDTFTELKSEFNRLLFDRALESRWKTLGLICGRPYWRRLWVVQEFILGKQCAVHVGLRSIRSAILTWFVHYAKIFELEMPLKSQAFGSVLLMQDSSNFQTIRVRHEGSQNMQISTILNTFRDHNCSDPRDKIYSLLGLGSSKHCGIQVDYTLDADTVYSNAVRSILVQERNLLLICNPERYSCQCTNSQHDLSSLPSWVPNFMCLRESHTNLTGGLEYNPSGQEQAVITDYHDSNVLWCKGLHVGTISKIHVHGSISPESSEELVIQALTRFVSNVSDSFEHPDLQASNALPDRLKYVHAAITKNLLFAPLTMDETTFVQHCTSPSPNNQSELHDPQHSSGMGVLLANKALFYMRLASLIPSTAKDRIPIGPIFGACYPFCQEGDIIVALYGSPYLLALRADPRDVGRYKVLGEVCVPQFLEGQAVGMFQEQDFELT